MQTPIQQNIKSALSAWYLWIFPLIALGTCGWLLREYYRQRGPTIKIYFDDASNIQADKTRVRFHGVTVGMVKKIILTQDGKNVVAEVDLQSEAKQLAVDGSKFWVVVPKVNFSGVSGLETLFEGPYITVQPGKPDGDSKSDFTGQLGSDTNEAIENTTPYNLETANAESISVGDTVTFRGLNVGSITKLNITKSAQAILMQFNIHNKYVRLIRTNTVFWKKVGIQANLGIFSSDFKINSLESILHGGVELFTPDVPGEIAKANTVFRLAFSQPKGSDKWNPNLGPSSEPSGRNP